MTELHSWFQDEKKNNPTYSLDQVQWSNPESTLILNDEVCERVNKQLHNCSITSAAQMQTLVLTHFLVFRKQTKSAIFSLLCQDCKTVYND